MRLNYVTVGACAAVVSLMAALAAKTYIDKKKWEEAKIDFDNSAEEIHEQIRKAKDAAIVDSYESAFNIFMDIRRQLIEIADSAYMSFDNANRCISDIKDSIREASDKIATHITILEGKMLPEKREIIYKEYQDFINVKRQLNSLLRDTIEDKNNHLEKVRAFNHEVHNLNEYIRDNCGPGGHIWYMRLQERKRTREAHSDKM